MTDKPIDYYFSLVSPFTYLGHERFLALAGRYGLTVHYKPCDVLKIFSVSGGVPVKDRAPQRQAYRLTELRRWGEYLNVPINVQPRFFPAPDAQAARVVIAAGDAGGDPGRLALGFLRAVWVEERNIAAAETIRAIVAECGQEPGLVEAAERPEHAARFEANTREAINRQVFGAPTWIYNGELFWGQDRLAVLEWRLKQG